jgi:hypothetical protein
MKFNTFLLFTFTFFITSTNADEDKKEEIHQVIEVSLEDFSRPLKCNIEKYPMYLCLNNNNPIIIKYGKYAVSALGKDNKNNSTFLHVKNVKAQGLEIFITPSKIKDEEQPTLSKEYMDKIGLIKYFFRAGEENTEEARIKGSPVYEKVATEHLVQKNNIKKNYDKIFQEKEYSIELENGKKLNCRRGSTKLLSEKQKSDYIDSDYGNECGSFSCNPITIKGKTYSPTLIYGSSAYSTFPASVHLLDNQGIGPQIPVKKVFSKNSKLPLHDYSAYIQSMKEIDHQEEIELMPESLKEDREKIFFYKDFDLILPMDHYKKFCEEKNDGGLEKIFQARQKLLEKLANVALVEFLEIIDGKLTSNFIEPNAAIKGGCFYDGVYLNPEAALQLDKIKKNFHPDKNVDKTISMDRAIELFNKARAMTNIAWGFRDDGCVYRAHLMARKFEAEGVRTDKVWMRGEVYLPGTDIKWDMHVAPIVYVEDKGKVQKIVIDPSLFDHPVTVDEWDNKMAKKTVGKSVITVFPPPGNSPRMERSSISFSSSDAFLPIDPGNIDEKFKMDKSLSEMERLMYAK